MLNLFKIFGENVKNVESCIQSEMGMANNRQIFDIVRASKRFFVFRYASDSYRAGAIYKLVKQAFIEQAHKSSFTNLCTACSNA